jgi:signal peptidase II
MSKSTFVILVAGAVFVTDQLSKWAIRRLLEPYQVVVVIDSFFHVTHVRNSGGAFSLLANASDAFRVPFFLVVSFLAIGALLYFLRHLPGQERWAIFALAGILGGALGNLVDRIAFGQVTDFLDFHWRGSHWPAFNVADSFITIGVAILLVHSLFPPRTPET